MMIPRPPSAPTEVLPPVSDDPAELARQYSRVAVETLAEIAQYGKTESSRVAAATTLLERGYGKTAVAALELGDGPSKIRIELV